MKATEWRRVGRRYRRPIVEQWESEAGGSAASRPQSSGSSGGRRTSAASRHTREWCSGSRMPRRRPRAPRRTGTSCTWTGTRDSQVRRSSTPSRRPTPPLTPVAAKRTSQICAKTHARSKRRSASNAERTACVPHILEPFHLKPVVFCAIAVRLGVSAVNAL